MTGAGSVEGGGLRHAFVGQLLITLCASLIGVPIGCSGDIPGRVCAGQKDRQDHKHPLRYRGKRSFHRHWDFVYAILVRPVGHFNGWAGRRLAIIMIPVVLRTTEDMLSLVPWELREAAFALGAPYYKVIIQVVYRGAATGILTGILLSIARVAGETAPLLFTSFNNSFFSLDMNNPMASLTATIFQYATGPTRPACQAWRHPLSSRFSSSFSRYWDG